MEKNDHLNTCFRAEFRVLGFNQEQLVALRKKAKNLGYGQSTTQQTHEDSLEISTLAIMKDPIPLGSFETTGSLR